MSASIGPSPLLRLLAASSFKRAARPLIAAPPPPPPPSALTPASSITSSVASTACASCSSLLTSFAPPFARHASSRVWSPHCSLERGRRRYQVWGARRRVGDDQRIGNGWRSGARTDGPRRGLFIQTEPTPNPKSKKLIPGKPVLENGTLAFSSREEAKRSPLARAIFRIDGVENVFLGSDFISVTAKEEEVWPEIQGEIFASIQEFYDDEKPVLDNPSDKPNDAGTAILEGDDSTVCLIKDLIETRIRPTVQQDGGDIAYRGYENGIVKVEMQGSCDSFSKATLKQGVQNMLMHYIPEVMGIEDVTNHGTEEKDSKKQEADTPKKVVDKSSFDRLRDLGF